MTTLRAVAALAWMATASYAAPAGLTVVIFDYTTSPHTTLTAAAQDARHALKIAGVETKWLICQVSREASIHCDLPPAGTYLEVKILPPGMDKDLPKRDALAYAMQCAASEHCGTSSLFYGPVTALARDSQSPLSLVMAYVMAHEIGHLLGLDHTSAGIMKARFDGHDMKEAAESRLRFEAGQVSSLQAAAAAWTKTFTSSSATKQP